MEVLSPQHAPVPLTTLDERLSLIESLGVDTTVVLRFTPDLAAIEPEDFIRDVALRRLGAREIVVGFNHRFGRGARGDAELLRRLADTLDFTAHVVPPLLVDGVPISSTEIRAALQRGEVERAAALLGRHYSVAGEVVRGASRGKSLGFPTANLRPDRPLLVPLGVYAARAVAAGAHHGAVVNVGRRPTFGENEVAIEAHLLDFAGELYGSRLDLAFVRRLRAEQKFGSVADLRAQIARDVEQARHAL
jgi:riboflavin kinase/FMN adenylyltransferase